MTEKVKKKNGIDMLNGPLAKKLVMFALPIFASSSLQQLFNSADVAVAGRFARDGALAAVGSNSVLVGLFVNLFVGLSVGANVVISQLIGQQNTKEVKPVVQTSMLFSLICGIFSAVVGIVLSRPLLELIDTPADVLDRAVMYLRIYCIGMPFIIPYNYGAAILRSIGDTKRPMFCLIGSGVLNVCLNLLLVIVFKMDVAGVAVATVVSNIFSSIVVIIILCRETSVIRLDLKQLRIEGRSLKRILRIGAPAALQSAVFSLSNICLQSAINSFGSDAVGGMTAALNFEMFGYFIVSAFSQSAVTFIGQNYGACKYDRCKKIMRLCLLESVVGMIVLCGIFIAGSSFLIKIYTVKPLEIEFAMVRIMYILPCLFITACYEITGSALRGMGRSAIPAVITVVGVVLFRVIWVYLIFPHFGSLLSLLIVYPISWVITGGMMLGYYAIAKKGIYFPHNYSEA